jgi:hypothetical protein
MESNKTTNTQNNTEKKNKSWIGDLAHAVEHFPIPSKNKTQILMHYDK